MTKTLWELFAEEEATNQAITAAGTHANEEWVMVALEAMNHVVLHFDTFTSDDVWDVIESKSDIRTHDNRAMGWVIRRAKLDGKCVPTGSYIPARRKGNHKRPLTVWRSLVRGQVIQCVCVEYDEHRMWNDCIKHPDTECYTLVCTNCGKQYFDCEDQ